MRPFPRLEPEPKYSAISGYLLISAALSFVNYLFLTDIPHRWYVSMLVLHVDGKLADIKIKNFPECLLGGDGSALDNNQP
ncbi:MAG: hypothetical protein GY703_08865 [Gammaproteobacteria bacterium]|nr:hypothetical protein [Gammaproteobacteria bacterium]